MSSSVAQKKTPKNQIVRIVPEETLSWIEDYVMWLQQGDIYPGNYLRTSLIGHENLTKFNFLDALLNTKIPQIFAESSVVGDGSDWTPYELDILGNISMAVPVTIFDNGHHTKPIPHKSPFVGTLIFTPGALLRNGQDQTPADWTEVTTHNGKICTEGYYDLYNRRLMPVFHYINTKASSEGKYALITIPGLGCGQFAGPFRGKLGSELQKVLERILKENGKSFPHIKVVYYDPFDECENLRQEIHGISLMVRPFLRGNSTKSQLCQPSAYAEDGDDFSDYILFSVVAWDHVSWPGNDYFGGSRCTDDGVKAAATSSMAVLTGIEGSYDPRRGEYLPPSPYRTWGEVVEKNRLQL